MSENDATPSAVAHTGSRRPLSLSASLIPLIAMFILLAVGYGVLGLAPEPLLILSAVVAGIVAFLHGFSWTDMMSGIREKLDTAMPALLVLISIGILIGTWMIAGTIPMMIYFGLGLISAKFIVLISFVISAIVSVITGTSWGSAGTVGVALMGIAAGLDAPMAATAGAIVAGAYFGDKLSPLSDTTNLAPIAAGSTLWEHIRHMLYTTIPATIVALIVYFIAGIQQETGQSGSARIDAVTGTLGQLFDFNVVLLLPMVIVLGGALLKLPTLPTIIGSSIVAGALALIFQDVTIESVFAATVDGFSPDMLEAGHEATANLNADVAELVSQGGMASMTSVILIAFSAFAFAGIMSKSGALDTIIRALLRLVKRTGDLILSTVLSCITMAIVTGNSYLSIIVPGELFKDAYQDRGLAAKNLSRTLEDSGTVLVPLVPWSSAGVYMAGVLGVSVIDYAPWAVFCYVGFVFAILLGYIGFGIAKTPQKQIAEP
jgi:NhaC family Na+:H+ antiporter